MSMSGIGKLMYFYYICLLFEYLYTFFNSMTMTLFLNDQGNNSNNEKLVQVFLLCVRKYLLQKGYLVLELINLKYHRNVYQMC